MACSFDVDELVARVGVWSRRLTGSAKRHLGAGPLIYDSWTGAVTFAGKPLRLSRRDLLILEMLLRRCGHHVSKDRMLMELQLDGYDVSLNGLEAAVCRLRRKIPKGAVCIASQRGLGYVLEEVRQ